MPRVNHFELPADNPERAIEFYRKVFGWQIQEWGDQHNYWLVKTGDSPQMGINGAIAKREDTPATTLTIGVENADDYADKIRASGGKVLTAKLTIPKIGYMYYCEDTEGTSFGIIQPDMSVGKGT